uniref:MPN domain-containing protein n=1 Tax=Oxyrrhis marina TaxID=2969 RepID=A0A7S3UIC3_OXYMA|mmetsp:Transcript_18065/g.43387  ORF Transcript_18065/g.43387 Transcript_18065/m.43387 type:complete len:202 (+) Transcript_18065:29-634(+)
MLASGEKISEFTFSTRSYAKLVSHVSKFPTDNVTGLLLGHRNGGKVEFVDVVPLFHTHTLSPMLQVACMLVEAYGDAQKPQLQIVGMYYASSFTSGGVQVPAVARAMSEKISANCSFATVWMIDAPAISRNEVGVRGYHGSKPDTSVDKSAIVVPDAALGCTKSLLSTHRYTTINDMDDHLQCAEIDWLNETYNKVIAEVA